MTTQLVLQFQNVDDLTRVLQFLRETGINALVFKPKREKKKAPKPEKSTWTFGRGNFGTQLDHVNMRDFAYED